MYVCMYVCVYVCNRAIYNYGQMDGRIIALLDVLVFSCVRRPQFDYVLTI